MLVKDAGEENPFTGKQRWSDSDGKT